MDKHLLRGLFMACAGSVFAMNAGAQTGQKLKITDRESVITPVVSKLKADRMAAEVVKSRSVGNGIKLQVCKDAQGRMFKRIAGLASNKVNAAYRAVSRAQETGGAINESFEGSNGETTWLPEGWTRKSTEGLEYYQSWFVTSPTMYAPATADGDYYAEIIYADTEQDEWLITPEVTVPENGIFSFYSYFQPAYLFDMGDDCVDWNNMEFIEKRIGATLQIHISVDGGEWTLLKDVADDYKDMSLMDLLYATPSGLTKMTLPIDAYAGKSVKFAFRYVGKNGDAMFIDCVRVGLPELDASYEIPTGTLFWGLDKEFGFSPISILMEPVYTPLTWTNTTYNDAATYSWSYQDPETHEMTTFSGNDLTVTYKPDYTSETSTRNNFYVLPTLTASAAGASDGSYTAQYDCVQAGGRSEYLFRGDEAPTTFGLMTCNALTEGMTIMTVEADDPMEASTPIFGHNDKTTEWWTNHYFGGDQAEGEKAEVEGVINFFHAPESPMVIKGLWLNAKGQISDNAEFTAGIYPLSEDFAVAEEPIATATCKGSEVGILEGGMQNFLTLPFEFETPVVVSKKDFSYYVVKVSGFNSDAVTYFAPCQSMLPNTGFCYGWLEVKITGNGKVRPTMVPIANFESEYGECWNSFFINLDATYPWLQGCDDTFEAGGEGGSKVFALDSYYDASEFTFTANTADGALPAWLTASGEGRYGETKLTFTAAPSTEVRSCDVTVSAPGVSKVFHISQGAATGIDTTVAAGQANVAGIYSISGQRVDNKDKAGNVYIVKYADGTTRKVVR